MAPEQVEPVAWSGTTAMALSALGVVVASLAIPYGVDELPTSDGKVADVLARVAEHPTASRLGFLAFASGMLFLIPAMAALRAATSNGRGRPFIEVGTRLVAIGAGALAIGNSFAPASEPSAIRATLPREVMVEYMRHHLLNGWAVAIIAFYPLVTIGGVLVGVGLWRGGAVSRLTALLVAVPLVVLIAPPLCPPTAVVGVVLGVGFALVRREVRAAGSRDEAGLPETPRPLAR